MQYLIFRDRAAAEKVLRQFDLRARQNTPSSSRWAALEEHPVELLYAVPYGVEMDGVVNLAASGGELVDLAEATRRGFYFGPLEGRFYKALHKCQDAAIFQDAFAQAYGHAPFPVVRSLFFATLGSLYSAREHLKKVVTGPAARTLPHYAILEKWWNARWDEMHIKGELLFFLKEFNNSEKHGTASVAVGLVPRADYFLKEGVVSSIGNQYMGDALGLRMGSEGLFRTSPFAGPYERWDIVKDMSSLRDYGIEGFRFTFEIVGLPAKHLGKPLAATDPVSVSKIAVDYYFGLVQQAIIEWEGPKPPNQAP